MSIRLSLARAVLCQTQGQEMDITLTPASDRFLCAEYTLLSRKISAPYGVRLNNADWSYVDRK